jgi:hypothetical protein
MDFGMKTPEKVETNALGFETAETKIFCYFGFYTCFPGFCLSDLYDLVKVKNKALTGE